MKGTCMEPLAIWEGKEFPSGPSLMLIEPRRVPPHLALVEDERFFALSIKGVELDKEARSVLEALDRKKKEVLLIPFQTFENGKKDAFGIFSSYEGYEPPIKSCLAPLRDYCGMAEAEKCNTVHELLYYLSEDGRLCPPFLLRNSEAFPQEDLWIPGYSKEEVQAHLEHYQQEAGSR